PSIQLSSHFRPVFAKSSDIMASQPSQKFLVLGAGVIGLTTALVLREQYPSSDIIVVAKHFPGDRSIEYTSPLAGANWSSIAHDNGPLEHYDRVTFHKLAEISERIPEAGVGQMGMWGVFDAPIEETGILSDGKETVWYDKLCGLSKLREKDLPKGAV